MNIIIIIIGVFLFADGIVSILVQRSESPLFQFGRLFRAGIGIVYLIIGLFISLNLIVSVIVGGLSIFVIIDGIVSILIQLKDNIILHLERVLRSAIGVYLLFYSSVIILSVQ